MLAGDPHTCLKSVKNNYPACILSHGGKAQHSVMNLTRSTASVESCTSRTAGRHAQHSAAGPEHSLAWRSTGSTLRWACDPVTLPLDSTVVAQCGHIPQLRVVETGTAQRSAVHSAALLRNTSVWTQRARHVWYTAVCHTPGMPPWPYPYPASLARPLTRPGSHPLTPRCAMASQGGACGTAI